MAGGACPSVGLNRTPGGRLFGPASSIPNVAATAPLELTESVAELRLEVGARPPAIKEGSPGFALGPSELGDRRFDTVFAFNVAPFWQQPEAALGAIREHLAQEGAVYIFWDARHAAPARAGDLGNELATRLREGGFSVNRLLVEGLRPVPAVCVKGRPQGA